MSKILDPCVIDRKLLDGSQGHTEPYWLITAYLEASGHAVDLHGSLIRPVKHNRTKTLAKSLHLASRYYDIVRRMPVSRA
jgi:hypothetical protein